MRDYKVAVLRGGPSEEYDVSMQTGFGVLGALKDKKVGHKDIVINKTGEWLVDGFVKEPQAALSDIDVAFLALHGQYGEDGTVQRLLERFSVPYTGSGPYASAIAMNKLLTKEKLRDSGIKMAAHIKVSRANSDVSRTVQGIENLFGPHYVVKPISGGSSLGVQIVSGTAGLTKALMKAFADREEVVVEEKINGREATVGIVERFRDQNYYRLPVIEVVPPSNVGFFAAHVKYTGETEEICPGRFSRLEKEELEQAAFRAHELLELSQYSRSDFIVSADGVYFLEANTLPGLTPNSLLPKALQAVGCTYEDFVIHLLEDALLKKKS